MSSPNPLVEGVDYYVDPEGLWVFTADYLRRRGFCCHQGCRHCPYDSEPLSRFRASVLCVHEGKLLIVRIREPETREVRPYPPGGLIEPGETPLGAALRETFEETGYRVIAEGAPVARRYLYRWGAKEIDVTTLFVRARLENPESPPAPVRAEEILGVEWVPLEELEKTFAHDKVLGPILVALLAPAH